MITVLLRRVSRRVAAAGASLLIVVAAASYVVAPAASEALGATVATVARAHAHSSISGRITAGKHGLKGVTVKVYKVVDRRGHKVRKLVASKTTSKSGAFGVNVKPGKYVVVLSDHRKASKTLRVQVKRNKPIFIVGKVSKSSGLFGIIPVIFNY